MSVSRPLRGPSALAFLTLCALPASARADDVVLTTQGEAASLDPIDPPTMPSLTHADAIIDLDYLGAGIGQGDLGRTFTYMAQLSGEVPITTRAWHVGMAWDLVSAAAEGRGRALLYGNPEIWLRGVGWHESGLSAGGSLGVVIPLPRNLTDDAKGVLDVIRVVRPWDTGYFDSHSLTVRPSIDARLVLDPVVLQLRQGLDYSYDFAGECKNGVTADDTCFDQLGGARSRSDIVARTGAYLGVAPLPWVALGLELWQTYAITKNIPDSERAAFSLSPSVRLRLRTVQPGFSLLFPLSTPLEGIATDYLALRLHVRLALGDTAAVEYEP